jgi:hypothetical protein
MLYLKLSTTIEDIKMTNNQIRPRILTLEEIAEGLKDKKLHVVAAATGLSFPTLKRLAEGNNNNCTMSTVMAVSKYLTK